MSAQSGSIATWTLALTASCLRFTARRLSKAGLWYDDWLIVPAMVSVPYFEYANHFNWTERTLRAHMSSFYHILATGLFITTFLSWDSLVFQRSESWFKAFIFIDETCWTMAIWVVKYSLLAFYWRLFASNRRSVRVVIWALTAFVACWGVAVVATAFYCFVYSQQSTLPAEALFYKNLAWLYVGSWVPHIFIDLVLLGLPVPLLWKLQMQITKKLILAAIFACGGLVTIISIIRLANILGHSAGNTILWSTVEVNSAIICACLPSLRPILTFISDKIKQLCDRKSTHKRGSELLMDMLPVRNPASPASLSSSKQNWNAEPHPILELSVVTDLEANTLGTPELDAEAPGPHVLEMETVKTALQMGPPRQVAELEGRGKYVAEL